ncbi:MAG TPA: hypothetical protein DDY37_07550 [Legionella sp.]|nr:hypothetical protein [Legionella sp.]
MKKIPSMEDPLIIEAERDLRKNMRAINQRLNANPKLARLVLINPILVLEDLGVQVNKEVKNHIMNTLRFPPSLVKRRDAIAQELKNDFASNNLNYVLPLTNQQRAQLVFHSLKIPRLPKKPDTAPDALTISELRLYKDTHPLLKKLAEFERYSKGALIFYPRSIYEQYKRGEKKMHWVNAIRFPP